MTFEELGRIAFSPANTLLTILLIFSILYWIFTIISGVGEIDLGLDFDAAIDVDFDIDVDADLSKPDLTVDVPSEPSNFIQFLKYLNLDIIPITFFISLVLLSTWLININLSYYLPLPNWVFILTLIPAFFVSLFISKYLSLPLVPLFKRINHKGEISYEYLGRTGVLKSTISGEKLGSLEIIINKDPIKLLAKSKNGELIKEGSQVTIVDEHPEKKFFIVEKSYEI